jgi:hypothetical protein
MATEAHEASPATRAGNDPARAAAQPLAYAAPPRASRLWRPLRRVGLVLLTLALSGAAAWAACKWQLKADERAFNQRASIRAGFERGVTDCIIFRKPPNAASLRHVQRLSGRYYVLLSWAGIDDASPHVLRGYRLPNITGISIEDEVGATGRAKDTDAWVEELSRPDTGFTSVVTLAFDGTNLSDAGLKHLASPSSGLRRLEELWIDNSMVTDAGVKYLADPSSGLTALGTLSLRDDGITDASLRGLSRTDSGLKALDRLFVDDSNTTAAGVEAFKKARPGFYVNREPSFRNPQ